MRWFGMIALVLLAACATAVEGGGPASVPAVTMERRVLTGADGAEIQADYGRVSVPAVRGDPTAGTYQLAFVWLHSPVAHGRAPVVYLDGGPGSGPTWMAGTAYGLDYIAPMLAATDVILLDQRGTGESEPDARWRWEGAPPLEFFRSREAALAHLVPMHRQAAAEIAARGVRLDGFTTEEAADDVNDLRRALGLEKVSIFGFSYGTHLGLSVLRRHGRHIERAVLVGVEGPDDTLKPPLGMDAAFERIARMAAQDPNVAEAGDLWTLLERVRTRLAREPMQVEIDVGEGQRLTLPVGPDGLDFIMRADIGDASDIPVFPRLLYSIDQGDPSVLAWFVRRRAGWAVGVNAMAYVTDNASGASPQRFARIAAEAAQSRFGNTANFPWPEIEAAWPAPTQARSFRTPVVSDTPTLFLAGDLDWNTPPPQAYAVARGFSNATIVVVDGAGHEQVYPHPEVRAAVTRFLSGEAVSAFTPSYPPLRFVPLRDGVEGAPSHPSLGR